MDFMKAFEGKKTYVTAVAMVTFAVLGVLLGQFEIDRAVELVLLALGLGSLRSGISKLEEK